MSHPRHQGAVSSRDRRRRGLPYRHGFAFTLGGGAYVLLCLFVGLAAANSQINLLFLIFSLLLGGLLASGVASTLTMTGLRATRGLPASAMAGQTVLMLYRLANRKKRLASYSLHVREYRPPTACGESYLPVVTAGEQARQPALLRCERRGIYRFDALTVYTRFPFSLFIHYARFRDPQELVVFPAIGRLRHDALSLALRGDRHRLSAPHRGGQEEFYGLREYRHGDNPKWIHWRRSARLGTLIVREMSPQTPHRLIVLISVQRTDAQHDDLLERLLSLAATLIHDSVGQGFEVGLVVAADRADRTFPWLSPALGQQHWFELMRTLAAFDETSCQPLERLPRQCLRQLAGAHCLWLTRGLSDEQVDRQVRALAAWNIAVRPIRAESAPFDRWMTLASAGGEWPARIHPQRPDGRVESRVALPGRHERIGP